MSPENAREAAKHVRGATIAWGADQYLDLEQPDQITVELDDYAYCLAYTVRWRGQTRVRTGHRPFYGVGQHCLIGAEELLRAGHSKADARAFLFHESDELLFGDFPGPAKQIPAIRDACAIAKRAAASIDRHFDVTVPDPDLIKRWDIRMLVTEKRDVLSGSFGRHSWAHDGEGPSTEGFEPFEREIRPFYHPEEAAVEWLKLEEWTRG